MKVIGNRPGRLIISYFALAIFCGSILLALPVSSASEPIDYIDALIVNFYALDDAIKSDLKNVTLESLQYGDKQILTRRFFTLSGSGFDPGFLCRSWIRLPVTVVIIVIYMH